MTAREYLSEVQRLQTVIEQKQERIKEIRESVSTVRAMASVMDGSREERSFDWFIWQRCDSIRPASSTASS